MARRYHFSLGDSSTGPIGYCASILADSPQEALEKLQGLMLEEVMAHEDSATGDYVQVYFGPDASVTIADIDFDESPEAEEDDDE